MSTPSLQSSKTTPTIGWCDQELAQRTVEKSHWLEIAVLVGAGVSILIAAFAFSQTGTFAQTHVAIPFGMGCLFFGVSLFLGEVIYKAVLYCKHRLSIPVARAPALPLNPALAQ